VASVTVMKGTKHRRGGTYYISGLNCRWHNAEATMNGLIYLVGLVVVIMFILSFLGLR
jgi:hypothetical protein